MTFQVSSSPVECNRVLNQQDYSCAMQPNAVLKYRPGICIEEMSGVDVQMQAQMQMDKANVTINGKVATCLLL